MKVRTKPNVTNAQTKQKYDRGAVDTMMLKMLTWVNMTNTESGGMPTMKESMTPTVPMPVLRLTGMKILNGTIGRTSWGKLSKKKKHSDSLAMRHFTSGLQREILEWFCNCGSWGCKILVVLTASFLEHGLLKDCKITI